MRNRTFLLLVMVGLAFGVAGAACSNSTPPADPATADVYAVNL